MRNRTTDTPCEGRRGEGRSIRRRAARLVRLRVWRLVFALTAITVAGYLLHRAISRYSLAEIAASVQGFTAQQLALVGFFAAASYLCLTGFDSLAIRYVRYRIPYPYVAMTSFASLSLGHNIGFAALSSGTIRFRLYSRYGLGAIDIAGVIMFCGVTVGLGLIALGGIALLSDPRLAAAILPIPHGTATLIGVACCGLAAAYVLICAVARRPVSLRGWPLRLPPARLALGQLVVGPLNFALVAACLHQAIGGAHDVPYLAVVAVYVLANIATLISHVPGGLGVVEGVVLTLLPGEAVIGGLIVFRVAYYFVPLILGTAVFAASEMRRPRRRSGTQS